MRIVVTGGGGFVGRALVRALSGHDVVTVDTQLGGLSGVAGDLCDPDTLERAFAGGCDVLVHLATIPGGAAETDPGLAWRVNIDATMALFDRAIARGCRRVVFASSIAVFGSPLPPRVDDDTSLAPRMLYGAHKVMMEQWLATLTRRGAVSGLSLRLPGIVARPRAPSGMKSAFVSNLFHALKAGEAIDLPMTPEASMWLMSVERAAANFAHAVKSDAVGAMTLPALHTTIGNLALSVASTTGADTALLRYKPDPEIEAAFGRYPPLQADRAKHFGFGCDDDLESLVGSALATLS